MSDDDLFETSSDAETAGVRVEVRARYSPEHSNAPASRWFFLYTIRISNHGDTPVQLLNRHWTIVNGTGRTEEVHGPGVVGEQPHLDPGEEFRYSSGAVLETPVGAMQGLYRMQADSGESFDAPIEPFTLAVPGMLH